MLRAQRSYNKATENNCGLDSVICIVILENVTRLLSRVTIYCSIFLTFTT